VAYLNVKERVIETKIVYYGAGLSGKTTNLEQIKRLADNRCGEMMTLDTDGDRTLFFDWMPFNVGKVNGLDVKIQLYTVPGQARYAETRKKVLAGADGVVLVLDSQTGALDRNLQTLSELREQLRENRLADDLPMVVQLNKRDLPTAMPRDELLAQCGLSGASFVEASAYRGEGVLETLSEITRLVLQSIRNSAREKSPKLETGDASSLDGQSTYSALVQAGIAPARHTSANTAETLAAESQASSVSTAKSSAPAFAPTKSAPLPNDVAGRAPAAPDTTFSSAPAPQVRPAQGALPPTSSSPSQLNEIISAQRALARKIEALEGTLQQSISTNIAELDRRVSQKIERLPRALSQTELDATLQGALASALGPILAAQEATQLALCDASERVIERSAKLEEKQLSASDLSRALVPIEAMLAQGFSQALKLAALDATNAQLTALETHVRRDLQQLQGLAEKSAKAVEVAGKSLAELQLQIVGVATGTELAALQDLLARRLGDLHAAHDKTLVCVNEGLASTTELIDKQSKSVEGIDKRLATIDAIERKLSWVEQQLVQLQGQQVPAVTLEGLLRAQLKALGTTVQTSHHALTQVIEQHSARQSQATAAQSAWIERLDQESSKRMQALASTLDAIKTSIERASARISDAIEATTKLVKGQEPLLRRAVEFTDDARTFNAQLSSAVAASEQTITQTIRESSEQSTALSERDALRLASMESLIREFATAAAEFFAEARSNKKPWWKS